MHLCYIPGAGHAKVSQARGVDDSLNLGGHIDDMCLCVAQVVANEFYDPTGRFEQQEWAAELFNALKGAGGLLHTRRQTYEVIQAMITTLSDRYTEFLPPSQFRRALRRPHPAERNYLQQVATSLS